MLFSCDVDSGGRVVFHVVCVLSFVVVGCGFITIVCALLLLFECCCWL